MDTEIALDLVGKSLVVAGAAGAVGEAVVREARALGATVFATDVVAGTAADAIFPMDLRDGSSAETIISEALMRHGRIDALINTAAVMHPGDGDCGTLSEAAWRETLDVNLTAAWRLCRVAIPHLIESRGNIVNVSSVVALRGSASAQFAYTTSKGGLLALTRELAVRYGPDGVRANVVCPGVLVSGLAKPLLVAPGERARREALIPLRRLGTEEDIASVCLFLATDAARYVTGTEIIVDGGASATLAHLP